MDSKKSIVILSHREWMKAGLCRYIFLSVMVPRSTCKSSTRSSIWWLQGAWFRGEQLPPVRKLAEQLLINPNTVARAYRELESARVLNTRRGSGVFVSDAGSPLARGEQNKILSERIDILLTESRQMNIDLEEVVKLLRQRSKRIK